MDLKEIKKLVRFGKSLGLKSLAVDGFYVEFGELQPVKVPLKKKSAAGNSAAEPKMRKVEEVPTLDDLNSYIYGPPEEHA